jgi:hypothetical protein
MPISIKQLLANRANAQKSTGPKTEDGKAISKLNGLRHGLTGAAFILTEEDRIAWKKFSDPMLESFNPVGPIETQLAHMIVQAMHRINRIHAMEQNTLTFALDANPGESLASHPEAHNAFIQARAFVENPKAFNNYSLYEQRINRMMLQNMKKLEELQAKRKADEQEKARENALIERRRKSQVKETTEAVPEIGFAISAVQQAAPAPSQNAPPAAA